MKPKNRSFEGVWKENTSELGTDEYGLVHLLDKGAGKGETPFVEVNDVDQKMDYSLLIHSGTESGEVKHRLRGSFFQYQDTMFLTVRKRRWFPGSHPVFTVYKVNATSGDTRIEIYEPDFRDKTRGNPSAKPHPEDWKHFSETRHLSTVYGLPIIQGRDPLVPDYLRWLIDRSAFKKTTSFTRVKVLNNE
ncbi:MAG: hypothetical protein ABEJ65_10890 [bacterium]